MSNFIDDISNESVTSTDIPVLLHFRDVVFFTYWRQALPPPSRKSMTCLLWCWLDCGGLEPNLQYFQALPISGIFWENSMPFHLRWKLFRSWLKSFCVWVGGLWVFTSCYELATAWVADLGRGKLENPYRKAVKEIGICLGSLFWSPLFSPCSAHSLSSCVVLRQD